MQMTAAAVGFLSRNPAGITAVRAARDEQGLAVEFVLLEPQHTVVIAALNELPLQPRPLTTAEQRLVTEANSSHALTDDSFVLRVKTPGHEILALSSLAPADDDEIRYLTSLGEQLSKSIEDLLAPGAPKSERPDPVAVLETQRDVVLVLDQDFVIQYCNNAVITMFGWTPAELIGMVGSELIHPDDLTDTISAMSRLQQAEQIYRMRLRLRNAADTWTPVSITAIDQGQNPNVNGLIISIRPSDYERENSATLRDLQDRTHRDHLTGLLNRRALQDTVTATGWRTTARVDSDHSVSLFVIDIDDFKAVNDIHGHRAGDEVLRIAASRLRSFATDEDLLARIGSDEFVLVLTHRDQTTTAARIAHHIRLALSEPYELAGNLLHITASIGIATERHADVVFEQMLHDADTALVTAKVHGRDQTVVYDSALAAAGNLAQSQRAMVRTALDHGGLAMRFQPIVAVDGKIVGFEALARCIDDQHELHMPGDFLPAISASPLMVRLDRQGFEQACVLAASLRQISPDQHLVISCNFSANTIAQSDFVENVLATMVRTGASPDSLCVEITESVAFEASPRIVNGIRELYDAGVGIALDDFGTGYSSLSHLRDFPLTTVKLDRSFIQELQTPGPEQTISRAITELARTLGFVVVAEGIETGAQQDVARLIGIDRLQGWHFDKALTVDEVHDRLGVPS